MQNRKDIRAKRSSQLLGRHLVAALSFAAASLIIEIAQASSPAHGGNHAELSVNWWRWESAAPPVGWFIIDFVLFVGLLVYFARKPVRAMFLARHERIRRAIREAEAAEKQASDRHEEYRTKLANIEVESEQFVSRGRADGAFEREQILAAAHEYAERMRTDARAVIDQEITKASTRVRRQTAMLLLGKAEDTLRSAMTDTDRERLLEEAIAALEQTDGKDGPRARYTSGAEEKS